MWKSRQICCAVDTGVDIYSTTQLQRFGSVCVKVQFSKAGLLTIFTCKITVRLTFENCHKSYIYIYLCVYTYICICTCAHARIVRWWMVRRHDVFVFILVAGDSSNEMKKWMSHIICMNESYTDVLYEQTDSSSGVRRFVKWNEGRGEEVARAEETGVWLWL